MDLPWPCRQMGSHPRLPFPGRTGLCNPIRRERAASSSDICSTKIVNLENASSDDIFQHLTSVLTFYPGILEEYVVKNVKCENIARWLTKRKTIEMGVPQTSSLIIPQEKDMDLKIFEEVESGDYLAPMYTLSSLLCNMTQSSGFHLYAISGIGKTLAMYNPEIPTWDPTHATHQKSFQIAMEETVAGHVAFTRTPVFIDDVHMDPRFPKRIGADDSSANGIAVLCIPVMLPNDDLVGVVEFFRSWHDASYTLQDLTLIQNIFDWIGIAIHKSSVCSSLHQQAEMNKFLLDVSRTYLDDITDIDNIIEHIMRFAKSLVSADRCSLFLFDKENNELYSSLFDNGEEQDGIPIFEKKNEIRFDVSKGIAGHVALNKTIANVSDAYADPRFNREVDKVTGYTTNNILCFPIMSDSEVYGVVQMINKKTGGSFTKHDEENFTVFAIFCALALRYSSTYTKLEDEHNKHQIVQEQFKQSLTCRENEARELTQQITERNLYGLPVDFERFQFSVMNYDSELPSFFVEMLDDLCTPDIQIDPHNLARFTLTVKRNYHGHPYHNWHHAVTVTHTMYCIMKRHTDIFSKLEIFALLVACLGHDIDHRGFSNQFLQKINHPLAALYPTSTMERHHYDMLRVVLDRDGHNILSRLDNNSVKFAMDLMKHAILATDLAVFFTNHKDLSDLLSDSEFDISNQDHSLRPVPSVEGASYNSNQQIGGNFVMELAAAAFSMAGPRADSTAKKWETTKQTVYDLYNEFWCEGDLRKEHGFTYVEMMDRDAEEDVPSGQIGFYTNVSIRCYEILTEILPGCSDLLVLANENLENWRMEAKNVQEKKAVEKRLEGKKSVKSQELGVMLKGGMWVIEQSRLYANDLPFDM